VHVFVGARRLLETLGGIMGDIEFRQAIATRKYTFVPRTGRRYGVTVSIGKPYSRGRPAQWLCPYRIAGGRKSKVFAMAGVDSMQALLLATQILRVELEYWARKEKGRFLYDGKAELFLPDLRTAKGKGPRGNAA